MKASKKKHKAKTHSSRARVAKVGPTLGDVEVHERRPGMPLEIVWRCINHGYENEFWEPVIVGLDNYEDDENDDYESEKPDLCKRMIYSAAGEGSKHVLKQEEAKRVSKSSSVRPDDLSWLVHTVLESADIIEAEGLDDDEEATEVRERAKEIAQNYGVKC